jgi:nucleotide sugar dehydrogenase
MEAQVSKGFVILAQNTSDVDYVRQAYALALSIKNTQKTVSAVSLITNDVVPDNYQGVFVVKSTIEPNTCDQLVSKYKLRILHNPEFLTARTAYHDFHNQTHIVLGKTAIITDEEHKRIGEFYQTYYPNAVISYCSATESESMKIFCNSFYSVKIQFFNELYLVCQKNGADYKTVVEMMLKNGWINPMHTDVPGPDGQLSYGGLCFPKDTNALNEFMKRNDIPNRVLDATIAERNEMRDDKDNCE